MLTSLQTRFVYDCIPVHTRKLLQHIRTGYFYLFSSELVLFLFSQQNSEAMVSIDMPAGPSEVLVIADKQANPVHIASDLLSQVLTGV